MPKICFVDDHTAIAEATMPVLLSQVGGEFGGIITTFSEAVKTLPLISPALVILDNRLGDGTGIEIVRQLRAVLPDTRWLLYSGYASGRTLTEAISVGIDGAVAKRAPLLVLINAAKTLLCGCRFFCDVSAAELRALPGTSLLTPLEQKILEQIALGYEAKEIAACVGVAHKTVLNSLVVLRRKSGTVSMVQLADFARANGFG